MKTRGAPIQRCACGKKHASMPARELDSPVQRSTAAERGFGADGVHPGVLRPSSGGAPLPRSVREKMEAALGHDFADVRVHHGGEAESIGAVAFTRGTHLHFAPTRYQPHSAEGRQLLGHELAHVVQQRARRVAHPGGAVPINADPALEREADAAGSAVAAGRTGPVDSAPGTPPPIAAAHGGRPGTIQARPSKKHRPEQEQWVRVPNGAGQAANDDGELADDERDAEHADGEGEREGQHAQPARAERGYLNLSGLADGLNAGRQQEPNPPRKYLGLAKLNQVLRWISNVTLQRGMVEVQAAVHSGKLVMSSNADSRKIRSSLKQELSRQDGPGQQPEDGKPHHLWNINNILLSDEGFKAYRQSMLDEIEQGHHAELEKKDALQQAGSILDTIRGAVTAVKADPEAAELHVVPDRKTGKGVMHAEQSIYEDLAVNRDKAIEETRKAMGYEQQDDAGSAMAAAEHAQAAAPAGEVFRNEGPVDAMAHERRADAGKVMGAVEDDQAAAPAGNALQGEDAAEKKNVQGRPPRLLVPAAGTKRQCAACHAVEQISRKSGIFSADDAFLLLRTSAIHGHAFNGRQGLALNAMKIKNPEAARKAVLAQIEQLEKLRFPGTANTDSELEQARPVDRGDEKQDVPD